MNGKGYNGLEKHPKVISLKVNPQQLPSSCQNGFFIIAKQGRERCNLPFCH
jgi:hypothetical protein